MRPFFLMLYGYPASGKYTIAQMIAQKTGARLIDNHLINNPIFQVMRMDGKTPFKDEVWNYVHQIRALVFDCIAKLANPGDSFIFTNVLTEETPGDRIILQNIQTMAEDKKAVFIPVQLNCELPSAQSRVANPERTQKIKMDCPDMLARIYGEYSLLQTGHPNLLALDNSRLSPEAATAQIMAHIAVCCSK